MTESPGDSEAWLAVVTITKLHVTYILIHFLLYRHDGVYSVIFIFGVNRRCCALSTVGGRSFLCADLSAMKKWNNTRRSQKQDRPHT